jgi:hypothetical protein
MKEFIFFIRKERNSQETLSPENFLKFIKSCEIYIANLKNQGKLISAQPIEWTGKIISVKGDSWDELSFYLRKAACINKYTKVKFNLLYL